MRALREKLDEKQLLQLLNSNDRAGYEYLYDNYSGAIYGAIKRIVKNDDIAADVLQDVFVKIWRNISKYDESKGKLFTWMVNISRNEAIDKVRSKGYTTDQKNTPMDKCLREVNTIGIMDCLKTDYIGIVNYLEKLTHDERLVINLAYFEGFTHSEISSEYNIPLGTVKSRIKSATGNLRRILAE